MHGMSGMRILVTGLVVAVLGGVLFGISHFNDIGGIFLILSVIVLLAGLAGFILGFALLIYALRDPVGIRDHDANVSYTALIRCMVAMSVADGDLDDAEVTTIARIYGTLTGEELDETFIVDIAESMSRESVSLQSELAGLRPILTTDLKEKIIKASFYILAADGVVSDSEDALMEEIRSGLDFPVVRYKFVKSEFFAGKSLTRAQDGE
jgi:uncharacterized tellurite resistance protein B-like protein